MNINELRFGNAAGTIKRLDEVAKACKSAMTDVTIGSITLEERAGNTGDVYYFHPTERWSLNSLGLPNMGLKNYLLVLPEMRRHIHASGKRMRVSIAGFSPKEYAQLAHECVASGADEIELNLGCPNVWGKDGQKPIASYHPELTAAILEEVYRALYPNTVAAKISPVEDASILASLANELARSPAVECAVVANTVPNQNRLREEGNKRALNFNDGQHMGGLAGSAVLDTSSTIAGTVRDILHRNSIIGVGGIFTGQDAMKYLRKGAVGFQCATGYIEYGSKIFSDILEELADMD